jgi:ATP-binding cassette, subfamily C, bacterial
MFSGNHISNLRKILAPFGAHKKILLGATILIFLTMILEILGLSFALPFLLSIFELEAPDLPFQNFGPLAAISDISTSKVLFLLMLIFTLRSAVMHVAVGLITRATTTVAHQMRTDFSGLLFGSDINVINGGNMGDSLSIVTNESVRAAMAIISFARVIAGALQIIFYVALMIYVSWQVMIFNILSGIFIFLAVARIMQLSRDVGKQTTESMKSVSHSFSQAFLSIRGARAMGYLSWLKNFITDSSLKLRHAQTKNLDYGQWIRTVREPLLILLLVFQLIMMREVFTFTPSEIMVVFAISLRFLMNFNIMVADIQKFIGQLPAIEEIDKVGSRLVIASVKKKSEPANLPANPLPINLRNVGVSYGNNQILQGLTFSIKPKTIVALIGPSGSGKTTCMDLICGLRQPDSGSVTFGSYCWTDIESESNRKRFGYVDQFPFLINGTLRENLSLGRDNIDDKIIIEKIGLCGLTDLLMSKVEGLDFLLTEGGRNLSGGQRQRLAICRSLLQDPAYLFLDEPTSSMDAENSDLIIKTLRAVSKQATVIVISHDPKVARQVDQVISF